MPSTTDGGANDGPLSRRRFVQLAGVTGADVLAGCGGDEQTTDELGTRSLGTTGRLAMAPRIARQRRLVSA
ncbi:hypothetical protein [Halorhabdus salina]|uniref:hypothetical protein n=1 Tax=Halorhabdus salina TaxID=2750670 RepID=UPI0015EF7AC0|nr:hypothetical protein [Halorhabdus salina]